MSEPLQLTPEEISAYEAAAQQQPASINPLRDLSADDLFSLATQDKEFDLVNEFRRNKDLWGDQNLVSKVADVHERIKQRGFQLSDIPGPGKMAHTAFGIAKGFGKQAWNYANALIGVPVAGAIGEITGDARNPGFHTELAQEGQRRVMENVAGTESGMFGVAQLGKKALNTVKKSALAYSGVEENLTPEQKVSNLWSDVGVGDIAEDITKGKGAFLTPIGVNVREELEAAGKPIRPEEVQALAAGDPVSFYTYGRAFGGAGKAVGRAAQEVRAALPAGVTKAVQATAAKLPTAEEAAGKAIQATGNLVDLGGRAVKVAGPTAGFVKGAMTGGPIAALAGLKGGEIAAKLGSKVSKIGEGIKAAGKEVAGETPVTSATAQLAKDVASSVPSTAAEIGKGLAFDIGTAALTSESPHDTQSVGIGAFFGGMNAAKRAGGRIMSGQIVAPREWGVDKYVPPSGQVDSSFENMHIAATKDASPAVKVRLNAIRQFLKGSHADADVFLAKDSASLENTLKQNGVSDAQAKTLSQQEGFFTANIPGKNGGTRRVIIARNVDAAPHEAFHAIQDVLGEDANQHIDQIVRQEYGPQWEQEGQRYANRIAPGGDWREIILDSTGTGLDYAKEKIAMSVGNEYRNITGAEPTAEYVQARTKEILGQKMDAALEANQGVDPNQISQQVWRDILSPQEATAIADSYLARELAAENFDMVFKNLSAALQNPGLPGRLARVVANLVSTLGGEPLSPEVTSQIGQVSPKFKVTEAVRLAPHLVQPKAGSPKPEILPVVKPKGPSEPLLPSPKPNEPKPEVKEPITEENPAQIAAEAPTTPIAGGTASPRELLGTIAEAIAQRAGVKINYLSAPEEPAAATTSNRDVRRQMIETFRTMPPEARSLWEKTFFPEKVLKLKGDKYQVLGWAPEVFAANAHKLAAKLEELGVSEASPYPIEKGSFTSEGWQELYRDVQKFVQNQMGGRTGAGESLVVPKMPGMTAPPEKGQPAALDQTKADLINMLFNFRLPDTARVQKGKLPLNIAGQDVSEATKPGRTAIPIIPRGSFEGAEAARQGIEGRPIKEVNPLRQQIEAAAQAKGVPMPEFLEAIQRLNLENIKEVQIAPEVPEFRGNTLTLSAGFQPPKTAKQAEELVKSVAKMTPKEFDKWAHETPDGLTEAAYQTGLNAPSKEFVQFLNIAAESFGKRALDLISTNPEEGMILAAQQQFFNEAWQAATGEGSAGYSLRKEKPGYQPKFPVNVNTSETNLQKKVLDSAPEISDDGGNMSTQLQPKKAAKKEFKMKPAQAGFSKAWILPDGTPVQLGGKWHHEFINESPELRSKYGLPMDENTEQNRIEALKEGFVQVNWADASGRITIEAREKDWPKQREAVRSFVERNADKIDWIKVYLFDDTVQSIKNQDEAKVFTLDDIEKPAMVPFLDLDTKRATGDASDRLFQKAVESTNKAPAESFKKGLTTVDGEGYWVDPKGEFIQAPDSHEMTAYEINNARKLGLDLDKLQREMDKIGSEAVYHAMNAKKYLRAYNVGPDILAVEGLGKWEDIPRTQREKMEDAAVEPGRILYFNDRKIDSTDVVDLGASSQPKKVAEDYAKKAGIKYTPSTTRSEVPVETAKKLADFYEAASHSPEDAEVKKSYEALAKETLAQYSAMKDAGYTIEPWTGEGEPYKSSADMVKDVTENKHLFFRRTEDSFGKEETDRSRKNPMLEPSGIDDLLVNDVFRAVHDFFGHAKEGLQFGPKGGFNAWKVHSEMYSPDAQGALAAETLAQNFWVNFGKQIRRTDGSIPAKGDKDYVALPDRQFAEQKNLVIPDELLDEVRAQFQPRRADEDLFGAKPTYTKSEVSKMTRAELKEAFPEAIIPKQKDEAIPSDITGSPLFKRAGNEEAAVKAFADGLVKFARENRNDPVFKAGVEWYDEFTPMLKKEFGEHADLFAELLAATSPQTGVETNFAYAVDAIESLKAGRFNKIIPKFNEGLEKIATGAWEKWYNKELPNIPEPPKNPTPAAFLEHWIFKHDLKPRQSNGKLYGIHSLPVLQVLARKWLTEARGPKTLNFVENLLGKGEEATIDLWSDRTMRRIGYAGQERWRILPKNIGPVSDKDFAFAQKAYRAAAERLGMKPSSLQAALWFAEKKLWAENGWSPLDLGDFRQEMKKLPMMRQGFQSRLTAEKKSAKVRPAEALDLGLIQPR
jgi:hypothetical protein